MINSQRILIASFVRHSKLAVGEGGVSCINFYSWRSHAQMDGWE